MTTQDEAAPPTRIAETHTAVVLLTGDRAYKWKKPVDLGFVDYRERTARSEACRRELELNRRLAPDVYLDVATLSASDGETIEDVLVMRRLPDERRLSRLVQAEGAPVDCIRQVSRAVAGLHARTRTPRAQGPASAAALRRNWEDNLEVLRRHAADVGADGDVARVAELAFAYLDGRDALFAARAPLACDGHGDLLADDIFCLDDGPRVIDCLDFAEDYRLGDPLLDAAFLAMDLEFHGRPDLGSRFLGWYREFSGEPAPATLTDHYIAYRAHVRAKVACLRAEQGGEGAHADARRLHRLCLDRLLGGQAALVLVGGLPGSGKSTVARGLADVLGYALLSSDEVRKETAGVDRDRRLPPEHYTADARTAVYAQLLDRARRLLERGEPVILDASWGEPSWREAATELARSLAAVLVPLECGAPRDVLRERLRRRARDSAGPSDADAEVLDRLAASARPWSGAADLATTAEPGDVVTRAADLVRARLRS